MPNTSNQTEQRIVLASSSPRRRELLSQISVNYTVIAVDIDETPNDGELATDYVQRMALEKALSGYHKSKQQFITLGADTCIECGTEIIGKPIDEKHASALLNKLSAREHIVHSAVSVVCGKKQRTLLSSSKVYFDQLEQNTINAYIATGEPMDKAGAYAIQGIAAQFVKKLEGSYSSVMGLPLHETAKLLHECGIRTL